LNETGLHTPNSSFVLLFWVGGAGVGGELKKKLNWFAWEHPTEIEEEGEAMALTWSEEEEEEASLLW
jgi:hypothetical protein